MLLLDYTNQQRHELRRLDNTNEQYRKNRSTLLLCSRYVIKTFGSIAAVFHVRLGLSPEPICRIHGRAPVTKDAASAVADCIRSGANVFIHGAAATPNALVDAMTTHAESNNLRDIGLYHIHTVRSGAKIASPLIDHILPSMAMFHTLAHHQECSM